MSRPGSTRKTMIWIPRIQVELRTLEQLCGFRIWSDPKNQSNIFLKKTKKLQAYFYLIQNKKIFPDVEIFWNLKLFRIFFLSRSVSTYRSFFESNRVDSSTLDTTIRFLRQFYIGIVIFRFLVSFLATLHEIEIRFFFWKKKFGSRYPG